MSQSSEVLDGSESKDSVECDSQLTANISNPPDGGMSEAVVVAEGVPPWLGSLASKSRGSDNEALLAVLLVLMHECGFTTAETPANPGAAFDVRLLRLLGTLRPDWNDGSAYRLSFSLAAVPNALKLVAVPVDDVMIINLYLSENEASSIVVKTYQHVSSANGTVGFSGLRSLSNEFKTLCCHFRDRILEDNRLPAPLKFTNLPYEIILHICDWLDPSSLAKLCSTCDFLYSTLFVDEALWMRYAKRFFGSSLNSKGSLAWKDYVVREKKSALQMRRSRRRHYDAYHGCIVRQYGYRNHFEYAETHRDMRRLFPESFHFIPNFPLW